ncbi:uncharacterized protein BXZ73DRAFT_103275 [Epithele typhae]|uniref:uncharacterized protein n=1 Tax=Epithele typhae TaxID=378194 RepID=UPI00200881EC|nr:uncharacterized protein BXZ73DRAFT_103275 [Epithele typhae]KAH9925393.1 hypothetical protein BXZ73DRAFT_103275 [Epithele typhae]
MGKRKANNHSDTSSKRNRAVNISQSPQEPSSHASTSGTVVEDTEAQPLADEPQVHTTDPAARAEEQSAKLLLAIREQAELLSGFLTTCRSNLGSSRNTRSSKRHPAVGQVEAMMIHSKELLKILFPQTAVYLEAPGLSGGLSPARDTSGVRDESTFNRPQNSLSVDLSKSGMGSTLGYTHDKHGLRMGLKADGRRRVGIPDFLVTTRADDGMPLQIILSVEDKVTKDPTKQMNRYSKLVGRHHKAHVIGLRITPSEEGGRGLQVKWARRIWGRTLEEPDSEAAVVLYADGDRAETGHSGWYPALCTFSLSNFLASRNEFLRPTTHYTVDEVASIIAINNGASRQKQSD